MRCFVAVWPTSEARDALAAMPRPAAPVRWLDPRDWHVTLAFLGDVSQPDRLAHRLRDAGPLPSAVARAGPVTTWFSGDRVLVVPVAGLDSLAADVRRRLAPFEALPFRGHLTLARARRAPGPPGLAGSAISLSWPVSEIVLAVTSPGPRTPRYTALARIAALA